MVSFSENCRRLYQENALHFHGFSFSAPAAAESLAGAESFQLLDVQKRGKFAVVSVLLRDAQTIFRMLLLRCRQRICSKQKMG